MRAVHITLQADHVELQPDHIIVAGSIEYLVAEAMSNYKGVWVKARDLVEPSSSNVATSSGEVEVLSLTSEGNEDQTNRMDLYRVVIERTFICVVPVHACESAITASTTDVHVSGRANPRRRAAELCDT